MEGGWSKSSGSRQEFHRLTKKEALVFFFGQKKNNKTTPPPTLSAPSSCAEQHIPPAEPWSSGSQERRNPQQKGLSKAKNENLELRQSGEGTGKLEPRWSLAAQHTELLCSGTAPSTAPKSNLPWGSGKGLWCQDPPVKQGDPRDWLEVREGSEVGKHGQM